jgi:hypothetical protein
MKRETFFELSLKTGLAEGESGTVIGPTRLPASRVASSYRCNRSEPGSLVEPGTKPSSSLSSPVSRLREQLRNRFPGAHGGVGCDGGKGDGGEVGLVRGKLVEVVSVGGGAGVVMRRFLERSEGAVGLVDGGDGFDPEGASDALLGRLLWVRCRKAVEAVRAADLLLRDGNLRTVVMDLRLVPERELLGLPMSVWHRLRMLAERGGVAVGVFARCQVVACAARRWRVSGVFGLEAMEQGEEALWGRLVFGVEEVGRRVA